MATKRTVYFDRRRGGENSRGRWVTIIKQGERVDLAEYRTEFEARASIGLDGGSMDPLYQPADGKTGGETVES